MNHDFIPRESEGPFAETNRLHRRAVDSPWGPADRGPPHRLRAQWREPDRARHLRVEDFDGSGERLGRWIGAAGMVVCLAALAYFAWRLLRP